ncbi:uncharacterized protein F4812DRAFT_433250 [Daldinia caldariorum]|uniref:uncharacterized protein n=1 Tax=Daldinia caldariorum TaxID=326644 RepID=UPI0020087AAA|nr:uncharacterized protein F4812DRAFT_433250 [Daldinia caldariorum]KAI1466932.1 hypothetical protein F4812DRAFT_433250 [Daldinia caldariorum]
MVSQATLAFLGLASTAVATLSPLQLRNLNDLRYERVVVEVRQVSSSFSELPTATQNPECESALQPLGSDVPTVAPELLAYLESFVATADTNNPTILCEATKVPQSLSSQYSSYDQAASSWLSKHSSDLEVIATKCKNDEDASVTEAIESIKGFLADNCGATSGAASGAAVSSTVSPALAARPTGMVAGAVAAAGALGVAVLL